MLKKSLIVLSLVTTLAACGPAQQPPPADQTPPPAAAPTPPPAAEPAPAAAATPAPNNDAEVARLKAEQRRLKEKLAAEQAAQQQQAVAAPPPPPPCGDCGVIAAITPVRQEGQAGWAGTLGGAAAGGLAGNQFGRGKGNTAMTVVGVLGGALAGREVQKQVTATTVFQVLVNMDAGGQRAVTLAAADGLAPGIRVHVDGNAVQPY